MSFSESKVPAPVRPAQSIFPPAELAKPSAWSKKRILQAGLVVVALIAGYWLLLQPYSFHTTGDTLWRCNHRTGEAYYCTHSYPIWRQVQP